MKTKIALFAVAGVFAFALAAGAAAIAPNCRMLYYVDNSNKNCDQKEFCGMYMYRGLRTYETKEACLKDVELKADVVSTTAAATGAKCNLWETRISDRIASYNGSKDSSTAAYLNISDRLSELKNRLTANGYDATKLTADLQTLGDKINKFVADYEAYMGALTESQSYACGHSNGEFKAKLAEARKLLQVVKQDHSDIKNYYLKAIKPDLQQLRDQIKKSQAEAASSTLQAPDQENSSSTN